LTETPKRALITGITGQDGSYLTEFLFEKRYGVHGLIRRTSLFNPDRIDHVYHDSHLAGPEITLHYGDLTDGTGLRRALEIIDPDEVYNLGAQSHVRVSFPYLTWRSTGALLPGSSSEMFGASPPPQSETTPFYPRSPYGVSKLAAHWFAVTTAKHMASSCATAFCSIMKVPVAAKLSLPVR
jgi:GDPmannose 4,6-dehydratase